MTDCPRPVRALTYQELEVRVAGLSADVSRLTAERDELARLIDEADFYPDAVSAELALRRSEARVAVLREALDEIEAKPYRAEEVVARLRRAGETKS